LTVTLAPEPISVAADPTRLAQIIVNLLTNAAKYTDPGGCIWLTTRREDGQAVLRIRDTGIGIASEMLPRVFDLFAQADVSPDRAQGGLGIGLALVRSLVEMHGGTIRATSPGLGQGSEFTVRLPALSRSADRATGPEGTTKPKLPPRRVLLVEDNADTARTLGLVLRRAGHDVLVAHDGPAAIEMARNQQPDVVLLDIGLPGMSGYEVARTIRDELNVPLIAMTGYAKEEGAGVQFDHYLLKPVSPDALLKLLADPRRA
jgi:CheY-like chemotaxis protein